MKKNKTQYALTLIFGFYFFNSQASTKDSLWNVWNNSDLADTTRFDALYDYTWNYYLFSNADSAFQLAQLGVNFATERKMKRHTIYALNVQGISFSIRGNFQKAKEYYLKVIDLTNEIGDRYGLIRPYNNLGIVYQNLGEYELAIDYYSKALELSEESQNIRGMISALNNIGPVYSYIGDYPKSLAYTTRALELCKQAGDREGEANALLSIGVIYFLQNNYSTAMTYYQEAKTIYEEISDAGGYRSALDNMAMIYKNQGNFELALSLGTESLKIAEELDEVRYIIFSLNNMGNIHFEQKNYSAALEYFFRCLKIQEEINYKTGIVHTLNNIGGVYLEINQLNDARHYCHKSFVLAREIQVPSIVKAGARRILITYARTNDVDSALTYLSVLKSVIDDELKRNYFGLTENEKALYFSALESDFNIYYECTNRYKQQFPFLLDTSFNVALACKGLSLKSSTQMRNIILESEDSSLISDYLRWTDLKQIISVNYSKGKDTKDLETEANELEKNLIVRSDAFSDFDKIRSLDWKQIRASLKPGECAIEFVNFATEIDTGNTIVYAALLVKSTSEHPEMIQLCTETDLKNIIGTIQGNNLNYINTVYGSRAKANKALYEKIWAPIEPFLQGVENIYYSPTGLLHKISFAALSKDNNVFLCDNYNLEQKLSTGNITMEDKVAFGELENFLLMGGVDYSSPNSTKEVWSYLPGSLQETETIHAFLQTKKMGVNYFKDENASEAIFKEKIISSTVVHIATHGFFFPDPEQVQNEMKVDSDPNQDLSFRGTTNYANWNFVNNKNPLMRSGIVFSGANDVWNRDALAEGEDGILTALEVSNLDLRNTKLVVLSACETGLGDIKGSEGVFGLQRAFKMAGVKYLIMSLWQVPDKETSEFMILFYKNLIKIKDIPLAFQKTQKAMRKKYDPYYWGAFVLIE